MAFYEETKNLIICPWQDGPTIKRPNCPRPVYLERAHLDLRGDGAPAADVALAEMAMALPLLALLLVRRGKSGPLQARRWRRARMTG
ncbi:hypothetical protein ZWY2020_041372 [Hordeum vulgare]|nr:hypothetical protein ZWY2020_041372 [Hordeum vulgare]